MIRAGGLRPPSRTAETKRMAQPDEQALAGLLGDHARDVEGLVAENFALQAILLRLAAATAERPDLRPVVVDAFDEAASFIRQAVLRQGPCHGGPRGGRAHADSLQGPHHPAPAVIVGLPGRSRRPWPWCMLDVKPIGV